MRLADFEALVQRLQTEVPAEYLEGVMEIEVSRNTLPHPTRSDIYTLGECIPLPLDHQDSPGGVLSRIVLYHGSFQALARLDSDFDWFAEAWDTLTHELRHHLEWKARAPDLEEFDWAAEQNFARQDGERFDPLFYRSGEKVAEDAGPNERSQLHSCHSPKGRCHTPFVWCDPSLRRRNRRGSCR